MGLGLKDDRPLGRNTAATILLLIIAVGLALRLWGLDRHFFWFDEGLLLDIDELNRHTTAWSFAKKIWHSTTYNPGWALLIWWITRHWGVTLWIARFPSFAAGVLAIVMLYAACRRYRLDRPTALAAALLMALSWPQIEYSQQILPYAGLPLLTCVILWCLAGLMRAAEDGRARVVWGWSVALTAACALHVVDHNSFVVLLPLLAVSLAWCLKSRREQAAGNGRRASALAASVASLAVSALVSLPFFLAKRGEGARSYLNLYYPATYRFRTKEYPPFTDPVYLSWVPHRQRFLDALYFAVSRTYDAILYLVNLFCPTYVTPIWGVLSFGLVAMVVVGIILGVRGRLGRAVQAVSVGFALTLGLLGALSALRLYPYGGTRQLLFLSPLAMMCAATGWRAALRRFPAAVLTAMALCLVLYATRVPRYYRECADVIDTKILVQAIRETGTRTFVVPLQGEQHSVINYYLRKVQGRQFFNPPSRIVRQLVLDRKPILLMSSHFDFREDLGKPPEQRSFAFNEQVDPTSDFRIYDVRVLLSHPENRFRGGQPSPGVYLYFLKPKLGSSGQAISAAPRSEPTTARR